MVGYYDVKILTNTHIKTIIIIYWFLAHRAESSSELFCRDHLLSVVHPSVRPSVPSVCKLFQFSSSSQEPLGQFQQNLAQGSWVKGIQVCSNEWPRSSQRGENCEIVKIH